MAIPCPCPEEAAGRWKEEPSEEDSTRAEVEDGFQEGVEEECLFRGWFDGIVVVVFELV